jgi:predicted ATPase
MNVPSRDQTEEWRRQLYRAIEEFDRLSSELFGPTEVVYRIPHSNGLGVWIGVKSVYARQRLETVHRLIFGGFAEEARWTSTWAALKSAVNEKPKDFYRVFAPGIPNVRVISERLSG